MNIKKLSKSLRKFRVFHRWLGLGLALLLIISAVTGVLLALKKDIDVIQPPTQKGSSKDLSDWKPLAEISTLAETAFHEAHPDQRENLVDRLDVRPSKGIVKVLFEKGYWEVQIDGKSGAIKSIAKRHSDWIENLHDGSIISDSFKLVSMNVLGFGLLFIIITGTWLWFGPRKVRKEKRKKLKIDR
ncbi:MAG: PepSY domain-containing protein [Bacteroidota bacterium]